MKPAVVFALCGLAFASAALEPGLKVKVCLEGEVAEEDCRYTIPKTVSEAVAYSWVAKDRSHNCHLPGLSMYCPSDDYSFCVLYDTQYEEAAGTQIALPVDGFNYATYDLADLGFVYWTTTMNGEEVSYWTSTEYFVSSENAESGNGETIRDGLWVPDADGNLIELPSNLSDLSEDWSVQGCIDTEGTFYFYQLTTESTCDKIAPWFAIYHNSTLVGSGFFTFGTMPDAPTGSRVWLESPTLAIIEVAVPNAPQCIYNLTEQYGSTALGIMYIEDPTEVVCSA